MPVRRQARLERFQREYTVKPQRCVAGLARAFEKEDVPDFDPGEDVGDVSFNRSRTTARVENLETGGYWDLVKEDGEWRLQLSD